MAGGRAIRAGILTALLLWLCWMGLCFMKNRWVKRVTSAVPPACTDALDNPDRGFYRIHGFPVLPGLDCEKLLEESYAWDRDTRLSLVELHLGAYADRELDADALACVQTLLDGTAARGKHVILRFLYDWDGKNMETEPQDIRMIERHMEQLGPVINRCAGIIYTTQGLFVGNWGEMNGTRYVTADQQQRLARKLASVTDEGILLAVRMPMQWRRVTDWENAGKTQEDAGLAARLGLYNDGMLGSESDLGTYGTFPREEAAPGRSWRREDELAFQEDLCAKVPNGGEVVYDTPWNDFPAALESLRRMHVSYLNRDYDAAALEKWSAAVVTEDGIWDGMDGLRYIERHLGYRFTVDGAALGCSFWKNRLSAAVTLRNEGFAPIYHALRPELVFVSGGAEILALPLPGDLRTLSGGRDAANTLTLRTELELSGLPAGDYEIFLRLVSEKYGGEIVTANVNYTDGFGCPIGKIERKC